MKKLKVGAAIIDVTPQKSMFLYGYPHVERMSEGVHDPLYASALIIDNGDLQIVYCAVDIIFISKEISSRVREKIENKTGIPGRNIMISASHTHSGPLTFNEIFDDPVVPKVDSNYISYLVDKLVEVIIEAFNNKRESKLAITIADGTGVGGNRRSKRDTVDSQVPIIVAKDVATNKIFALSTIYCMHPTILHEDSKLYSADFPGFTREYIKNELSEDVILLYHTGPSGNQSPRHFVESNTFDEAKRLGYLLGERITESVKLLNDSDFYDSVSLAVYSDNVVLPKKQFMSVDEAEIKRKNAKEKLEKMKEINPLSPETRTAEVDWFGAEENRQLAEKSANGELDKIYQSILPVEINIVSINENNFVFLPGELFVEYSLLIKEKLPNAFVTSLSNGVFAGYIVTEEAEKEGGYEASNSIFPTSAGKLIVQKVVDLVNRNEL